MKLNRFLGLMMAFTMLLSACSGQDAANDPSGSKFADSILETQTDPMKERMERRCEEITTMYYDLYASAVKRNRKTNGMIRFCHRAAWMPSKIY